MGSIYAKDVIEVAKSYIGYHEGPNNWTVFAQVLDACGYYAPQTKQNVAWCATFCNFCVLKAAIPEDRDDESKKYDAQNFMFQPSYNNYSASASLFAGYFKAANSWYLTPEKGDMIFFKMSDGNIGHVGIVEDTDGCITTIEGNAADQVQRKWYDFDEIGAGGRIAGFGRPSYDGYEQDNDDDDDEIASYNCVDVSEWNREVDWEKAKANGVEFAFIRCGFGRYYLLEEDDEKRAEKQAKWEETQGEDKYFRINMENAIKAGVKVGVYFYTYATDWDSSLDEAKICMRIIEDYTDKISFPIFLDVEEEANIPRITDVVMAFVNTLNYYNYNVGAYTSGSWYSSYFKNIDIDYAWLAYYGPDDGEPHTKPDYCDILQYSSKGTVDGIGSNCVDVDILYNNDMKLYINDPQPTPEPQPTPTPKPTDKTVLIKLDVLSRGSTGGQVNTLKALLNEFGFSDDLPLDGDFDYDTEVAVNHYKENYGLEPDGIVDSKMWNLLLR